MENQIDNFETFYSERLMPLFEKLKPAGNEASKWMVAGISSLFLCIACFVIGKSTVAFFLIVILIFSVFKFFSKRENFVYDYKEIIIKEIVKYINPGAIYEPLQNVSQVDYEFSGLYPRRCDLYTGEDLIKGVYKNVTYYCSELETSLYKGDTHGNTLRIFKGLFFIAPIGFKYGATYVWPADDVQLPVTIADYHFERFLPLPEIAPVDMNNSSFESQFAVYSNDGFAARSIIDEAMMSRMLHFRNQINRDVRFSFVNGFCFVAIEMRENLFEPALSDIMDKDKIQAYFFSVLLILSIINQLDLKRLV